MAVDWKSVGGGAASGAASGAAIGSFVPGIGTAIGTGVGALAGAIGGGLLEQQKSKETHIQKQQRKLLDQILASLDGNGPYSNLFTASDADFEKSFAAPARARFQNQTAPQIQQSYIQYGQQRGTGIEDALTRAGVDLDQQINENYLNYKQGAQNRASGAIGNILSQSAGAAPSQSWQSAAIGGAGGYLSSPAFGKDIERISDAFERRPKAKPASKGFEQPVE